jgi:hypothetical protein
MAKAVDRLRSMWGHRAAMSASPRAARGWPESRIAEKQDG